MPKRNNRESRTRSSASAAGACSRAPARSRRVLSVWIALALPLALLLVGTLAPVGLARSADREAAAAARKAALHQERERRAAARRARRASESARHHAEREERRELKLLARHVYGTVRFSCSGIRWTYTAFPDLPGNTVSQQITFAQNHETRRYSQYVFDGPSSTDTTPFAAPPGHYQIDAWARWKTNGTKGHYDIRGKVTCPAAPAFTIEKLQTIAGTNAPFTTSQLKGLPGQTVDYEIAVTNTGNVPLALGSLADSKCDGGTLSGGPAGGTLAVESSATYTCSHLLNAADQAAGAATNSASVTATPPDGDGAPFSHTSNTVVVFVPSPAFTISKLQRVAGSGTFFTTAALQALPGSTMEYELLAKNTGNEPLTMGPLSDPRCDTGTIAGGPGGAPLAPGATTTYTCSHVLDAADEAAGSFSNNATLTGAPPEGEGSPVTGTSNTVVVTVTNEPDPPPLGGGETPGGGGTSGAGPTPGGQAPAGGVASGSTATAPPSSGTLASKSTRAPALKGPQGCARGRVTIRVKSAGVASVIFYLDRHRLRRLTAHSARHGLFTLVIDTRHLKVGRHRLVAKFAMKGASSARVTHASRAINIVRCASAARKPRFTG